MRTLDVADSGRVLVVGEGQLGTAIIEAIRRRGATEEWATPTDWTDSASTRRSVANAVDRLPASELPVTVVWAAGRCGMSSTEAACAQSLDAMTAAATALLPLRPVSTHLLSSAGAFALGQPRSGRTTDAVAAPVPYAGLKKAEEALVEALPLGEPVIHRVSSVYGPPQRPGRRGIVTVLVANAAQLRTSRIYGHWSTLRNYVHADDVGDYVAEHVLNASGPGMHLLAAPRSHTIGELVGAVSAARRRPVPIRLVPADNVDDLTIDPSAIAPLFRSRPLDTAIRQMVLEMRHSTAV